MSTSLEALVISQARATGLDLTALTSSDLDYLSRRIEKVFIGLQARIAWRGHIGSVLSHGQVLENTSWTTQALSRAVRNRRVLKLAARDGASGYAAAAFDASTEPIRPLSGIKPVLLVWSTVDPSGWVTASWLSTPQRELADRTPRQALLDGDADMVTTLAKQATARMVA